VLKGKNFSWQWTDNQLQTYLPRLVFVCHFVSVRCERRRQSKKSACAAEKASV